MIKLRQHPQTQHASEPSNAIQRTVWRAGIYPKSQQNREVLVEHPPIIRETEGILTLKHLNNTFKALTAKNVLLRKKRKGYWHGPLTGSKILKSPCVHQPAGGCRLHVGAWFAKQLVCVRIEPLQFTVNLGQVLSWHWASRVFMVDIAQKPNESLGKSPKYIWMILNVHLMPTWALHDLEFLWKNITSRWIRRWPPQRHTRCWASRRMDKIHCGNGWTTRNWHWPPPNTSCTWRIVKCNLALGLVILRYNPISHRAICGRPHFDKPFSAGTATGHRNLTMASSLGWSAKNSAASWPCEPQKWHKAINWCGPWHAPNLVWHIFLLKSLDLACCWKSEWTTVFQNSLTS